MLAHWPEASPGESFLGWTGPARIDDADAAPAWVGAREFADSAFQREFSLSLLVAALAVLGYSVNEGGAVV